MNPTSISLRSVLGAVVFRPTSEPKQTIQPKVELVFNFPVETCPNRTVNREEVQYLIREGTRRLCF